MMGSQLSAFQGSRRMMFEGPPPHRPRQTSAVRWLGCDPHAWRLVAPVMGSLREQRSVGEKPA